MERLNGEMIMCNKRNFIGFTCKDPESSICPLVVIKHDKHLKLC